jgi:hypothetical protein
MDSAIRAYEKSLAVAPSILVYIGLTKIAIKDRNLGDETSSSGITPTTVIDHLCKHLMCWIFGAIIRSGSMTTKKPSKCPYRDTVSIIGRAFAPQVLNAIVMRRNPSMVSVYCQFVKPKSDFATSIIASMRVVMTKTLMDTLANQPNVDIHPM